MGFGLAWRQAVGLVLDLGGDARERLAVLPRVMRAEQKLSPAWEHDAHVRLGAASVAQVQCTQRLHRGHSAGHVASLASYRQRGSAPSILTLYLPNKR